MVIFAPIDQFGCFKASLAVTFSSSSRVLPKNGPPDAVRIIFLIAFFYVLTTLFFINKKYFIPVIGFILFCEYPSDNP